MEIVRELDCFIILSKHVSNSPRFRLREGMRSRIRLSTVISVGFEVVPIISVDVDASFHLLASNTSFVSIRGVSVLPFQEKVTVVVLVVLLDLVKTINVEHGDEEVLGPLQEHKLLGVLMD